MRRIAFAAIAWLPLVATNVAAAGLGALTDGLHTWQIEDTADVQGCCYSWRQGKPAEGGCRIDGRSLSVAVGGDCAAAGGAAQVYVFVSGGEPAGVWLFSSACPVTAESEILDHGSVSADTSLAWFRSVIESRQVDRDVREQALFALIQTESDAAFRYLDRLLTDR